MANIPISSFTAAANATGIGMSGFSLTGSNAQSMLDLAGTWNTSGTPTGLKLNVTDTASNAASLLMDLQVGGVSRLSVDKGGQIDIKKLGSSLDASIVSYNSGGIKSGFYFPNGGADVAWTRANSAQWGVGFLRCSVPSGSRLSWSSTNDPLGTEDVILARDAANTLALRNGVNAQTFRVYNTFTDASNYERAEVHWVGNVFRVGTYAAGTGTGRTLTFLTSGVERWSINASTGHLLAVTDNTYDIGANGATRPRDLYLAGVANIGGNTSAFGTITLRGATEPARRFNVNGFASMRWPSDGVYTFLNDGASDFGRLQFGGTTSSFPALKRNGTALETKLADDSAFAPHAMQYLDVTDGITAPGAAAGRARIYVDTADGDLKVVFADGTVKTIVTDT